MALKNFDEIIAKAKAAGRKCRVAMAGSDAENILKGLFQAQDDGFAYPILIGPKDRTENMLERLGLQGKPHDMVETKPGENPTQVAIDLIRDYKADVLLRGNIQTRDFLIPLLDKKNDMRHEGNLLSQVDIVTLPGYPKLIAIGDVTVAVEPDPNQKKAIIRNLVGTLQSLGWEKPNIALLSLVEEVSFHMRDTVIAHELVKDHREKPIADCNLVGPIAYDLILSKEAARLKGYDCPWCGEFDGIVAPNLLAGNLIVKGWQMHAKGSKCGVVVGAKVPVAIVSRSDAPEATYNSLACCAILPPR